MSDIALRRGIDLAVDTPVTEGRMPPQAVESPQPGTWAATAAAAIRK